MWSQAIYSDLESEFFLDGSRSSNEAAEMEEISDHDARNKNAWVI